MRTHSVAFFHFSPFGEIFPHVVQLTVEILQQRTDTPMEDFYSATVFERFALGDILQQVPDFVSAKAIDLLESDAVEVRQHKRNDATGRVHTENGTYNVTILTTSSRLYALCTCKSNEHPFCEHSLALLLALAESSTIVSEPNHLVLLSERIATLLDYAPDSQTRQRKTRRGHTPLRLAFVLLKKKYDFMVVPIGLGGRAALAQTPAELFAKDGDETSPHTLLVHPSDKEIFRTSRDLDERIIATPGEFSLARLLLRTEGLARAGYRRTPYQPGEVLDLLAATNTPWIFYAEEDQFTLLTGPVTIVNGLGEWVLACEGDETSHLHLHVQVRLPHGEHIDAKTLDIITDEPMWLYDPTTLRLIRMATPLDDEALETDIQVPPSLYDTFVETHLPKLAEAWTFADTPLWKTIEGIKPVPRLYLFDDEENTIGAELRFAYGDIEVAAARTVPSQTFTTDEEGHLVRVVRDIETEINAIELVRQHGLKYGREEGAFALRKNTDPVDFLLHHIPMLLRKGFEIFGEESLASIKVNRRKPSMRLSISSGIDWFDLQAEVSFGDVNVSLAEIRRALRRGRRYVKLADGSVGELPEEWLEKFKHVFGLAELSDEGLRFRTTQIGLLESLLGDVEQVDVDEEFERRRELLHRFDAIEDVPLPRGFQGELRPYQKAGYNWLHFLHRYHFGGCLADDMGLGKTVQVLVFLLSLRESGHAQRADLIVVPRSLVENWRREAARFTPSLRVLVHAGPQRTEDPSVFDQYDLVITTYGTALRDAKMLRQYTFHYVVLDESQAIKNPLTKTARALRLLKSDHRLAMTGTPVENNTIELWSLFAFINPGLLGNFKYFREHFATPIERFQDDETADLLRRLVYPFILRRTKAQVAPELPPRTERVFFTEMTNEQAALYEHWRTHYRNLLLGLIQEEGLQQARMKVLEGLLRLRQIAIHPKLVDRTYQGTSGKFELLLETLETLREEGHKALIFSQFVKVLGLVREELDARGIPYAYLDGQTRDRQAIVDRFQHDESLPFFLISLRAGGVGLNLTAADYVIHIDPWWNPAVEQQAADRTHRIGQDKPVFVYRLITRDTVEEKILDLQERKQQLVSQLITTEGGIFKNLTPEDIAVLFE
ncbi:hypothetical protein ARMA_2571 [Ardenticatena maritima]|uniref:Non-specific serine/threonine protein kinase n=2 Tax=Ardenticatena maritima TaxID=872965 RepID=A0A0M9UDL1_9CHLR|nr:hypothetical protein ARMA_2571 [Ardenticatena maritima]